MAKSKSSSVKNDKIQDKQMVRRGVGQHESNMHKGREKTKLKLGK